MIPIIPGKPWVLPAKLTRACCPACAGAPNPAREVHNEKGGLWRCCAECGLLWDPVAGWEWPNLRYAAHGGVLPASDYDRNEPKIVAFRTGEHDAGHRGRLLLATATTSARGTLLEVGFGGAQLLRLARASGEWKRVAGIELGDHFVLHARAHGFEAYYLDVAGPCGPEFSLLGQADLLVASEVLEHVPDPVAFLGGCLPYLAPDGVLWVTFAGPQDRPQLDQGEWQYWSLPAIEAVAERAALEIVQVGPAVGAFLLTFRARHPAPPGAITRPLPLRSPPDRQVREVWTGSCWEVRDVPGLRDVRDAVPIVELCQTDPGGWIDRARAALPRYPGKDAAGPWVDAALAWWATVMRHDPAGPCPTDDPVGVLTWGHGWCLQQCLAFCWLCEHAWGVAASVQQLTHTDGTGHAVVLLGAPATLWVLDVDHGYVLRKRDGRPVNWEDARFSPDLVVAQRDPWRGRDGVGMEGFYNHGPKSLNFQIGDRCNADCAMCWQAWRRHHRPELAWPELDAAVVEGLIRRYAGGLLSVELVSFGEPLLHPGFDRMVAAVPSTVRLHVVTNGSLLDRHLDLLRLPGCLTVSVDAVGPERYEPIRRGLRWARVDDNLRRAVGYVGKHPQREVGINMTVWADNADQIPPLAVWAHDLGLDYVSVIYGDGLEGSDAVGRQLRRDDPEVTRSLDWMQDTYPGLLHDFFREMRASPAGAPPPPPLPGREFCGLPWLQLDVGPDGRCHPCCRSFGADLGDWRDDVWRGSAARALREQILLGRVDPAMFGECARCPLLKAGVKE